MEVSAGDRWKDIPGYGGKYQASYEGQVRRIYGNGKAKMLTPYHKKNKARTKIVLKLTMDGKSREIPLLSVIALTFLGHPPPGHVPYHKNGLKSDNCAGNLEYISSRELGRKTGASSKRRPVAKLDPSGEPVAFYSSAREAARENHMSYQTVLDRCNGRVKNRIALDGHDYAWDDVPEGRPGRKPKKDKEGTN